MIRKSKILLLVIVTVHKKNDTIKTGRGIIYPFLRNFYERRCVMRRIAINMQNSLFCNAIADTLRVSGNELEPYTIDSPDKVVDDCKWIAPYAILLEVTGYTPWMLCERMKIRNAVKAQNPECKVVFIVDENAEKDVAKEVKQAKKDGMIDQFIYGSISAAYLADIVDSL